MTSTITNLVPGKRVQLPGMPCLVLKRQTVEQLLRERAERVNLRLLDWRATNGPDHYREAERLPEEAESHEEPGSKN